jgi:cytochrome c oxidase cbb3-type subunit 3
MKRIAFLLALIAAPAIAPTAFAQVTADTPNPLADNAGAIAVGHDLFGKMNCAGCHGYDLTGGMGPDLTDPSWQYGGKPGEIYHTIAEGTPRGMPVWKDKLTPEQIWQMVAYIGSKKQ